MENGCSPAFCLPKIKIEGVEKTITGNVEWFDQVKGYGFITGPDGKNVFVHYTGIIQPGYKTLEAGQKVSYETELTLKGEKAMNVAIET